jgi:hypothetical protein
MDWCEEYGRAGRAHLETVGLGRNDGWVRRIDFDPFEDILELDLEVAGGSCRLLIENPKEIWIQKLPTGQVDGASIISPLGRTVLAVVRR